MKTKIIYEDTNILVCYKPAGLAAQTSRIGQQDMVSELKNYLASPYLGIIHRLDQPVEGLLVFAKDKKSAAKLTASLADGGLNKKYYAVVCGTPDREEAELVDYLAKDEISGSAVIRAASAGGKKAVLRYSVVEKSSTPSPIALLDIHIKTGRFHQIRAQMAHAGLPLLGDARYGNDASKELSRELGVRNVALCAYHIAFRHPATGKPMEFTVEPSGIRNIEISHTTRNEEIRGKGYGRKNHSS